MATEQDVDRLRVSALLAFPRGILTLLSPSRLVPSFPFIVVFPNTMETVIFLSPLLKLLTDELNNVLKRIKPIDLISFSLLSKYTKSLVLLFNWNSNWPHIRLGKTLDLEFLFNQYAVYVRLNIEPTEHNGELTATDTVEITREDYEGNETTYQCSKPGFGMREWIEHMKAVTNTSNFESITFDPESEMYDIHSVAKTIKRIGVNMVMAGRNCSDAHRQLIFKTILTRRVLLHENPYTDRESLQKVLISNYDTIGIMFQGNVSLEELLVVNCKYLTLNVIGILKMETLNKFLKIWRTGLNTKLRYVEIGFDVIPDESVILKGIDHDVVDQAVERRFIRPVEDQEYVELMCGGYDIQGFQGMKATLFIDRPHSFELFIWE